MSGFGPVGSFPVGSIPGAGSSGTNYNAGTVVTVTFQGLPPVVAYTASPSRVFSIYTEVLHSGSSAAPVQVFGLYAEVLYSLANASSDSGFVSILW